jgi:hypothetical protein
MKFGALRFNRRFYFLTICLSIVVFSATLFSIGINQYNNFSQCEKPKNVIWMYKCAVTVLKDKDSGQIQKIAELKHLYSSSKLLPLVLKSSFSNNDEINRHLLKLGVDDSIALRLFSAEKKRCMKRSKLKPRKRSSYLSWCLGNVLISSLNFYLDTADTKFLDIFYQLSDELLSQTDERLGISDAVSGDILPVWSTLGRAKFTHSSINWYALAQFVEVVNRAPDLPVLYEEKASVYLSYLDQAVFSFDHFFEQYTENGKQICWFKFDYPESEIWDGEPHPFNHTSFLGATYAILSTVSPEPDKHTSRVKCLGNYWLKHTSYNKDGALVWPYAATRSNHVTEQVWKAGWTIIFPIEALKRDVFFDEKILQGIYTTITKVTDNPAGFHVRLPGIDTRTFDDLKEDLKYAPWYRHADRTITSWSIMATICRDVGEIFLSKILHNSRYYDAGWIGKMENLKAFSLLRSDKSLSLLPMKKYDCSVL